MGPGQFERQRAGVKSHWDNGWGRNQGSNVEQLSRSEGVFEVHVCDLKAWLVSAGVCVSPERSPCSGKHRHTHTQPQRRVGRQLAAQGPALWDHLTRTARELRLLAGEGLASWNLSWIRAKIMTQGEVIDQFRISGLEVGKSPALVGIWVWVLGTWVGRSGGQRFGSSSKRPTGYPWHWGQGWR